MKNLLISGFPVPFLHLEPNKTHSFVSKCFHYTAEVAVEILSLGHASCVLSDCCVTGVKAGV
jgi:hypothetical protein